MTCVQNSLEYFKSFSGCIVRISNGYLNLIEFILADVILYFCNSYPCLYALVDEIKFIYLFILNAASTVDSSEVA